MPKAIRFIDTYLAQHIGTDKQAIAYPHCHPTLLCHEPFFVSSFASFGTFFSPFCGGDVAFPKMASKFFPYFPPPPQPDSAGLNAMLQIHFGAVSFGIVLQCKNLLHPVDTAKESQLMCAFAKEISRSLCTQ